MQWGRDHGLLRWCCESGKKGLSNWGFVESHLDIQFDDWSLDHDDIRDLSNWRGLHWLTTSKIELVTSAHCIQDGTNAFTHYTEDLAEPGPFPLPVALSPVSGKEVAWSFFKFQNAVASRSPHHLFKRFWKLRHLPEDKWGPRILAMLHVHDSFRKESCTYKGRAAI